jgi:hypothetical protein
MNETVNWLLFYKHDGPSPSEFAELLAYENTLYQRAGEVKSWGESEETAFASSQDLHAGIVRARGQIEAMGYVAVREMRFEPAGFDYERLTDEITLAARQAFTAIREARPKERINAYAIVTDASATTIGPVANSVRTWWTPKIKPEVLWNSAEWSCWQGGEHFEVAFRMLLTQRTGSWPKVPFDDFFSGVAESSIRALERLDRECFFGAGRERENCVILFQVADSAYHDDAIKRLNTSAAYAQFRAWWESWN